MWRSTIEKDWCASDSYHGQHQTTGRHVTFGHKRHRKLLKQNSSNRAFHNALFCRLYIQVFNLFSDVVFTMNTPTRPHDLLELYCTCTSRQHEAITGHTRKQRLNIRSLPDATQPNNIVESSWSRLYISVLCNLWSHMHAPIHECFILYHPGYVQDVVASFQLNFVHVYQFAYL